VDSADDGADLELWATERRTDLLSRLLDRKVVLRASAPMAVRTRAIAAS
jgi:hypothetical protein